MAKKKTSPVRRQGTMAERSDRHVLYENSVQCVEAEIDFLDEAFQELRGRKATRLREDFCGTAAAACEWVRRRPRNHAIGVDLDPDVLEWGREHHVAKLGKAERGRLTLVNGDVTRVTTDPQDLVIAMNFSYWIFKERRTLINYFARVRRALADDGVFVLDCYGGHDSFKVLKERKYFDDYTYIWEQASYNPVDGHMCCNIHFKFKDGSRMDKAFTYDWRLWTMPELRDCLADAGFKKTVVYWQGWDEETGDGDGNFTAVESADPDPGWIFYIAALK